MTRARGSREVAIDALVRVDEGAFAHIVVPELLRRSGLPSRDRAWVTDAVYTAVRMQRAVDHLLARASKRPIVELEPRVRAAVRLGTSQLLADVPAHAAVGETVGAVQERARGFVNGVLRGVTRLGPPWPWPGPGDEGGPVAAVGVRTSHPDWIVEELARVLGPDEAVATLELDNRAPAVTLRVNPLRSTPDQVEAELVAGGARVERGALVRDALVVRGVGDLRALACMAEGRATPQDQASQAVVDVVAPEPGMRVLDVAAGPGGKATGCAERMGDAGVVVAADLTSGRARLVADAARRLGLGSVQVVVADGRTPPFRAGTFDRVLVDAPCSGLGVLRRRPDARWRVQPGDVADVASVQRALFASAAPAVGSGGVLVYSVCTLTHAETLAIDEWAAVALGGFDALAPPGEPWRPLGRGALLPPTAAGTDGMYVLRLQRGL